MNNREKWKCSGLAEGAGRGMQSEITEKRREVEIQIKEGCVARDQSRLGAEASYGNRTAVLEERW